MDFTQYQPVAAPAFQPVPVQPREKSYIHQSMSMHHDLHDLHDLHAPLAISIPSSHSQLEHLRLPKTTTHPLLSASAFKAWEPSTRHVHRQASAPGHTSSSAASSVHGSGRRHGYVCQRQQSTENDVFSVPHRGMYGGVGGAGMGQGQHVKVGYPPPPQQQPSYYPHPRQKSYSTHSATEVTV